MRFGTAIVEGLFHVYDASTFSGGLVPLNGSGLIDTTVDTLVDVTAQNSVGGTDDVTSTTAIIELLK